MKFQRTLLALNIKIGLFVWILFWQNLLKANETSGSPTAIKIDQIVSQDSNLGNFKWVIKVPLPTRLPGVRDNLHLIYDSHNLNNFSMGYGFNWDLPEIRKNASSTLLLKDNAGLVELVEKDGLFYEIELSRFVKLKKTEDGFKAIYPEGNQKLFDHNGLIIEEISLFSVNSIKYEWEKSRLKRISISSGDQVTFHYEKCQKENTLLKNQDLPFYKFGRWYQAPHCLSTVTYSADSRRLQFKYNDYLNLSEVFWDGEEDFKLFNANYSRKLFNGEIKSVTNHMAPHTVIGTPGKKSISLSLGSDRHIFKNVNEFHTERSLYVPTGIFTPSNGVRILNNLILSDFNNDGFTDYSAFFLMYSRCKKINRRTACYTQRYIETFLGKERKEGENTLKAPTDFNFSKAPGFDLPLVFHDLRVLVGDFNGDGWKDVIGCGEDSYLALNQKDFFQVRPLQFTCSKKSIIYDINLDGFSDVIDKNKIHLSGFGQFKTITETSSYLRELQASLENIQWGIKDFNLDLIPEKINENEVLFVSDLERDRTYEFWREGSREYFIEKRLPAIPLLSNITLPFGGLIEIKYDTTNSLPNVKAVTMDPLIGVPLNYQYNYYFPFFDPLSGHFLGFEIIERLRMTNETMEGSREILQYLNDREDLGAQKRKRYHGLLRRTIKCSIENCQKIPFQLARTSSVIETTWERMDEIHHSFIPVSNLDNYEEKSSRQYFKYLGRIDRYLLDKGIHPRSARRNTASEHIINNFYNFSELGPLSSSFVLKGHGLESHFSNYEYSDVYRNLQIEKVIYPGGVVLVQSKKTIGIDTNYKKILTKNQRWDYSQKAGKNGFTVKEITLDEEDKELTSQVETFTSFGRVQQTRLSSGKIIEKNYDKRGNPIYQEDESGSAFSMSYDLFGRLLKNKKFISKNQELDGTDLLRTENRDILPTGRLKKFANDRHFTTITYERTHSSLTKEIRETSSKSSAEVLKTEIVYFDGMGNIIQSFIKMSEESFKSTGLTLWTANNHKAFGNYTIFTEAPTLNLKSSHQIQFYYNSLGKVLSIEDNLIDQNHAFHYNGKYINHSLNNVLVSKRGSSYSGIPFSYQKRQGEITSIALTPQDNLLQLGDFSYTLDLTGSIKNIYNKRLGKGVGWQRFNNSYREIERAFEEMTLDRNGNVLNISLKEGKQQQKINFEYNNLKKLRLMNVGDFNISLSYDNEERVQFKEFELIDNNEVIDNKWTNSFEYDDFNRLKSKTISTHRDDVTINPTYNGMYLESLSPFIKNIERDHLGHVASIQYQNGMLVNLTHTPHGLLKTTQVGRFNERVNRNNLDQVKTIHHNYSLDLRREKLPHLKNSFEYNSFEITERPSITNFKRNDFGHLEHPSLIFHNPYLNRVKSLEGKEIIYRDTESILAVGDEYYFSTNFHFIDGYQIEYLRVDGKIVGAFITGKDIHGFYPIVSDFRNSIRQIYNPTGELLVLRNYSTWGELDTTELSNVKESQFIDRLIRYDFASLIRPYESKFLISKTRLYSPEIGEWATVDTTLLWNPKVFLDGHLDEVNGFSYARNNPFNYIDPSGRFVVSLLIGMAIGGLVGGFMNAHFNGSFWNGFISGALSAGLVTVGAAAGAAALFGGGFLGAGVGGALAGGLASFGSQKFLNPSGDVSWTAVILGGAFAGAVSGGVYGAMKSIPAASATSIQKNVTQNVVDFNRAFQSSITPPPPPLLILPQLRINVEVPPPLPPPPKFPFP